MTSPRTENVSDISLEKHMLANGTVKCVCCREENLLRVRLGAEHVSKRV
jgi:hypothetical protein